MKKPMSFDFLLDYLPANVVIKPAIGMYYIYFQGKIVLIFRKVSKNPQHNGIWIATKREDHASLKADIPAVTDFEFGDEVFEPNWLQLQDDHEGFEEPLLPSVNRFRAGTKESAEPPRNDAAHPTTIATS